ncbi:DUF6438 domain-containing protein [Cesiribacter sp. SM1]|uniref:DUF6438 domain-containing protein n=1 Tax=Cesiribacter sp. SM1 TaxID=2861196 RepID=UPI001CD1D287
MQISYGSSGCYGTCPSLYIRVDEDRNLWFWGEAFTEKEKGWRGSVSQKEYDRLLRQIHQLSITTLQPDYAAPWTDDQTQCVSIHYKGGEINSCAYGLHEEPVELRILFSKSG